MNYFHKGKMNFKTRIRKNLLLLTFIVLAGSGFLSYSIYKSYQKLFDSEELVEHAEQIIYQSSDILSLGKDLEAASRGFVISGDSTFLEPLLTAQKTIFARIKKLKLLVDDNPQQQQRVDSLNFYIHKRMDFSLKMVELKSNQESASAIAAIFAKQSKEYGDRMRQITSNFQAEENILLKDRKNINEHSITTFNRISIVMIFLLTIITILLIIATGNYLLQFKQKEKRAEELIIANEVLRFQNEEKEKRAEELIKAKEKAVESDNLKSAFLNNLSHEIRTPMNHILGFASLLNDPGLTDDTRDEYVDLINQQSHQLLHIITDIVEISRIMTGQVELKFSTFNFVKIMDELFASFKPKAERRNLQLRIRNKLSDTDAMIRGDLAKLKIVFGNLIENAIKFTDIGNIDIEYSRSGDKLMIAVKDTGIGIEEQEKKVIFDNFRQIEITMARKYGGMGLGLSISNAYIRMMSGVIRLESEPGEGSTFLVELPYMSANGSIESDLKLVQAPAFSQLNWKKKTLLISEDEEANSQYLQALLKSTGINLLFAPNGEKAVEQCKNHPEIDLVLMDIKMPKMDGLEATKIIKSFRKNLPIIAVTAFAMPKEREYILRSGCDEYLPKPFSREDILTLIQKFIGTKEPSIGNN